MKSLILTICIAIACAIPLLAKDKKEIPKAPLPSEIIAAKKIFLSNGGGSDLAYDSFYAAMKSWGHFQIVDKPEDADIIAELSYETIDRGTHVWSSTNTYTGATQVYSAQITDPRVLLVIYNWKTKTQLWSTLEHRQLARLERNREKETINAALTNLSKRTT